MIFEPFFEINNIQLDVTASMAIAVYPEDSIKADGLMQFSDIAFYVCKDKYNIYKLLCLNLLQVMKIVLLLNRSLI